MNDCGDGGRRLVKSEGVVYKKNDFFSKIGTQRIKEQYDGGTRLLDKGLKMSN